MATSLALDDALVEQAVRLGKHKVQEGGGNGGVGIVHPTAEARRLPGPDRESRLSRRLRSPRSAPQVRHEEQLAKLQTVLDGFVNVTVVTPDHDLAAEFFNRCRGGGVAATDVDMLICAAAARRGLPVFRTDGDFERYGKIRGVTLVSIPWRAGPSPL